MQYASWRCHMREANSYPLTTSPGIGWPASSCNVLHRTAQRCILHSICHHNGDVIIGAMASQITGVEIVCLTVCSSAYQRKYQNSASLVFVSGIRRWLLNSLTKGQTRGKCFHMMRSSWWLQSLTTYTNQSDRNEACKFWTASWLGRLPILHNKYAQAQAQVNPYRPQSHMYFGIQISGKI